MAETAYFYWPEISFEELDELVSSLKDQTEDKNLKVRETYLLRTKTRNITGSSVLELKKNNEISKMNVRKKIKISNLIFTIENRDGRISFDGTRHKRRVTFEELKKTKLWEKKKKDKFVNFWKNDYIRRATSKRTRLIGIFGLLGSIGLMLSSSAVASALISYSVLQLVYDFLGAWYILLLLLLELGAPTLVGVITTIAVLRVEEKEEENCYYWCLETGKDTITGKIKSHISILVEVCFIPIIFLIYKDVQIMSNINVLAFSLLNLTVVLNLQEFMKALSLALILGVGLTVLKKSVYNKLYIGPIKRRDKI